VAVEPPVSAIPFVEEPEGRHGEAEYISPLIRRVVANNPSPYTYHGTCSYIVGGRDVVVVDPGPEDSAHVDAILAALAPGQRVSHIVVTHTHSDHSPAAKALKERTGASVHGFGPQVRQHDPDTSRVVFGDPEVDPDPTKPSPPRGGDQLFQPDGLLRDGDVLEGDDWSLEAVHTPGHASNHLCYLVREEGALFTGDHVMGWSTTVVSPPDGNLGEYVASLEKLLGRTQDQTYLPGHGPAVHDPHALVRALVAHRRERSAQIVGVLEEGPATIAEIVPKLYASVRKQIWPAAAASVYAHLLDLDARNLIEPDDELPLRRASRFRLVA
jgi:glyoxylase-like metal-dependent hydrolase (beta-lactamase superfamily II)